MNRNQKIALGCGGAGCLGLILIVIVVAILIGMGIIAAPGITSYTDTNSNSNSNSNDNAPANRNSNTSTVSNSNSNSSSSEMSFDAKHRLYQAAGTSRDNDMMMRVIKKVGLGDGTGTDHQEFIKDHFVWAKDNFPFIRSINTPEKARAYVEEHIDD